MQFVSLDVLSIRRISFLLGFLTCEARRAKHAAGLFRIYIPIFRSKDVT